MSIDLRVTIYLRRQMTGQDLGRILQLLHSNGFVVNLVEQAPSARPDIPQILSKFTQLTKGHALNLSAFNEKIGQSLYFSFRQWDVLLFVTRDPSRGCSPADQAAMEKAHYTLHQIEGLVALLSDSLHVIYTYGEQDIVEDYLFERKELEKDWDLSLPKVTHVFWLNYFGKKVITTVGRESVDKILQHVPFTIRNKADSVMFKIYDMPDDYWRDGVAAYRRRLEARLRTQVRR